MSWRVVVAGVVLGVVSRIEEVIDGFSAGISSERTWVLVAAACGAGLARGPGVVRPAVAGALVLVVANAAWYAWIALTQPDLALGSVAGSPWRWFALSLAVGPPAGVAGRVARRLVPPVRRE